MKLTSAVANLLGLLLLRDASQESDHHWETGHKAVFRTDMFHCDDEMVFLLARLAFKDSPGECHFVPMKVMKHQSSH